MLHALGEETVRQLLHPSGPAFPHPHAGERGAALDGMDLLLQLRRCRNMI